MTEDKDRVLNELNLIFAYLRSFVTRNAVDLYSKSIIQKAISNFNNLEMAIRTHIHLDLPFIEVLIDDFHKYFKEYIDGIRTISNNYNQTNFLPAVETRLSDMNLSLSNYYFKREQIGCYGTFLTALPEVVKRFIKIGEASKDHDMAVKMVEEIRCLKDISVEGTDSWNPGTSYYASIVGPSFMGKTQTAFTLSHKINVIYVNLTAIVLKIDEPNNQPIYEPFKQFSNLFLKAINQDLASLSAANLDPRGENLTSFEKGFYTFGLMYLLIRSYSLKSEQSVEDRFLERINMQTASIPALTVGEFKARLNEMKIDLDKHLVFIDELPRPDEREYNENISKIRFLRSLCKAAQIPSLLCGTNSQVNNLIGKSEYHGSGIANGAKKWVKVFTHPIRASLKSTCGVMKFNPYQDAPRELTMCEFFDSNTGNFNYESFKAALFGPGYNSVPHLDSAMKLLELVFANMKTALPGIAFLSVKFIFDSLIKARKGEFQLRNLWKRLNFHLIKEVETRKKPRLRSKFSLTASVHILTLPGIHKTANESDEVATRKVNEHYFYFGKRSESSFDLVLRDQSERTEHNSDTDDEIYQSEYIDVDDDSDQSDQSDDDGNNDEIASQPDYGLFKGSVKFIDECYFADICDDFLLCYSLWNLWYDKKAKKRFTLATLYEDYLKSIPKFQAKSPKKVPNSLSLEILGLWSIAYASHVNRLGNASGLSVLFEFIRNIQYFEDKGKYPVKKLFTASQFPESLKSFLNRIRVPYLISGPPPIDQTTLPDPHADERVRIAKLVDDLASFIKIGTCHHPKNSVGWDVQFQIEFDGREDIGAIECKLWSTPVGLPEIYNYYEKACNNQLKFFILVAKKIQVSLQQADKFDPPPRDHSQFSRPAKRVAIDNLEALQEYQDDISGAEQQNQNDDVYADEENQNQHVEKMFNLWENPINRINLYSIGFEKETKANGLQIGKFKLVALKEHPEPTGIFILVETNFNPPLLSSSS